QKGSDAIGAVVQRRVQCAAGIAELTFPDASDAAVRGQPQRPAAIVDNPQDGVARQAVLTVPCHDAAASKAAESAFGADPERSVRIEEQRPHFALTDSAAGGMAGSDAPVGIKGNPAASEAQPDAALSRIRGCRADHVA